MKNDLFLKALRCENFGPRPPVWLMRQAGRYLPEYQALKKHKSLDELFHDKDSIVKITKLPVDILNVDAAILFADILHVVKALGFSVNFPKTGPQITPVLENPDEIEKIQLRDTKSIFQFLASSIETLKQDLEIPLIGFCGGPFTVASYILEHGHKGSLVKTKKWLYSYPQHFHVLLQKITDATIEYLNLQIESGVDALQIFDSWAGGLAKEEFQIFALPYLKQILAAVQKKVPVILFCRGSCLFAKEIAELKPQGISFDWQLPMNELRALVPKEIAIQGNLDPLILTAPFHVIETKTKELLKSMQKDPGFIVNLGHGMLPYLFVDAAKQLIKTVQEGL
ncbi:MAG: uroporphyrinogen decarboxylase [Simkaniaceae bacterium]|nr:uroporphyrinogen decarboxylase [Simkaniaceae bacterium]